MSVRMHATRLVLAFGVAVLLVGVLALAAGALAALPALLAFMPLLAGRYLGADRLERLVEAVAPARRRTLAPRRHVPRPRAAHPRGTRLLAFSLAKRPPPLGPVPA